MKGKQPADLILRDGSDASELGDLLQRRFSLLKDCLVDDQLWEFLNRGADTPYNGANEVPRSAPGLILDIIPVRPWGGWGES